MKFKRMVWPIVYLVTVAMICSWYEIIGPMLSVQQFNGTWRKVIVGHAGQDFTDVHLRVDGAEKWLAYPIDDSWDVQRSRISIRPSRDFFHVTLESGFDSRRNKRTIEYFVYRRDDQLYILRGCARLDPIRLPTVEKLIRVDDIPDKAKEAIATYLANLPQD